MLTNATFSQLLRLSICPPAEVGAIFDDISGSTAAAGKPVAAVSEVSLSCVTPEESI
jgi:hypothetical protein